MKRTVAHRGALYAEVGRLFARVAAVALLGTLGAGVGAPAGRALAAGSGIGMQATPGFGGQVRPGAWLPLVVDLRDDGADFTGKLVVPENNNPLGFGGGPTLHSQYTAPVVLAGGSHKRITLYVPAADAEGGSVTVRLVDGNGSTVASQDVSIQTLQPGTLMAGVVSADPSVARVMNGVTVDGTALNAVALAPSDLVPAVAALANFDLLVFSNAPTEALDAAQITALRDWVAGGGVLLVAGGPTARRTLAGLPPDLVPVRVTGTTTLASLSALSDLSGAALPAAPVVASTGQPRAGQVLAVQGSGARGVPLLVDAARGRGHVLYLALDMALAPLSTLSPSDPLWEALLGRALGPAAGILLTQSGASGGMPGMQNIYPIVGVLNTLPATALPSVGAFLILVILYVLMLGPGNYIVLRRLRRRELSWVTIPLMALLFCVGTFLFALRAKGSDVMINAVSVVHLDTATGPRPTETYLGLFSPTRGDYHLALSDAALPMALPTYSYGPTWNGGADSGGGLVFTQGEPTTVDFTSMSMWSMRAVVLQHETSVAGSIDAQLHLGQGGVIAGTVANHTNLRLVDAALVTAGGAQALGTLAPQDSRAVNLTAAAGTTAGPPPLYQLYQNSPGGQGAMVPGAIAVSAVRSIPITGRRGKIIYAGGGPYPVYYGSAGTNQQTQNYLQILQTVFQNGDTSSIAPILFLAWNHAPLTALTVNGETPRRQDLNLIVQPLWLSLGVGSFTLPEGVVAPQLVETDVANQAGGGGLNITAGNSATFAFTVPAGGHAVRIDTLSVNITANGGPSVIQSDSGALYDWEQQRWETVDLSTGDTHIAHAGRFVSPRGVVRLRLSAPASQNLYINNIGANIQIGATGVVH